MWKYCSMVFLLMACITQRGFTQNLSNKGKEFWVAWGHNAVQANFVLYLYAEQETNIVISIPGSRFVTFRSQIAAGQVRTYVIPSLDYMIMEQGIITGKAIHIECDQPVVAYAHQFAGQSSAATMLFPVETYGQTYYSLNMTQVSNVFGSHSWFYAIASEDNTRIEVTPSVNTLSIPAGKTVTINLNKGQMYNVFGVITSETDVSVGEDVTGSSVKSIPGADGICHPIAFFSGSSRIILVGDSGGDVLQQQVFPARAWGTRYLTAPTVNTMDINRDNNNVYRIAVRDPATIVRRNGQVLTGLQRNFYYEFQSREAEYIEADKQILVAQYIPSVLHTLGEGDPEMIYISPLEQGIKSTRFNATEHENITHTYLSAIVPTIAAASLKVDGGTDWNRSYAHPHLAGYTVKIKLFPLFDNVLNDGENRPHSISCDTFFTAITYGLGSFESYGYNAGTQINNLEVYTNIKNTNADIPQFTNTTCRKTQFRFFLKMGYKASRLEWRVNEVAGIVPNTLAVINNPAPYDSTMQAGRKYYYYTLPQDFYCTGTGTYQVPVKVYAPDIDNCDQSMMVNTTIEVKQGPLSDFNIAYTGCRLEEAVLTGKANANGFNLVRYAWNYDEGRIDSVKHAARHFAAVGAHPVKYTVIADNGCTGDTTISVITHPDPVAGFEMAPATSFVGDVVRFTDQSAANGLTLTRWYWNLGAGLPVTTITDQPQSQKYLTAGTYTIYHVVAAAACVSDTAKQLLTVLEKLDNIELPNVFTPNGDGVHDVWEMPRLQLIPGINVRVFNRWGQLVYDAEGYSHPWDGTYQGQPLPAGTYYYVIQTKNAGNGKRTGSVTILR